jgi:hypothetical protein
MIEQQLVQPAGRVLRNPVAHALEHGDRVRSVDELGGRLGRLPRPLDEGPDDRALIGRGEVGAPPLRLLFSQVAHGVEQRRLQAAEAEIEPRVVGHRKRKGERAWVAALGRPIRPASRGGASDASHIAAAGVELTIDGLGPRGGGAHTPDEWVSAESLHSRAELALAVTAALLET